MAGWAGERGGGRTDGTAADDGDFSLLGRRRHLNSWGSGERPGRAGGGDVIGGEIQLAPPWEQMPKPNASCLSKVIY